MNLPQKRTLEKLIESDSIKTSKTDTIKSVFNTVMKGIQEASELAMAADSDTILQKIEKTNRLLIKANSTTQKDKEKGSVLHQSMLSVKELAEFIVKEKAANPLVSSQLVSVVSDAANDAQKLMVMLDSARE